MPCCIKNEGNVLSCICCLTTTLMWGVSLFFLNIKSYRVQIGLDSKLDWSVSLLLMPIGSWIGWLVVVVCWNLVFSRPKYWIPRRNAWCSLMTGCGYAFAHASYMKSADGLHASVLAPLSSLYILFPPIVGLFQGKRITFKIAFGFCCSIACLLLLSGWIKSGPSDHITLMDWLLLGFMIFGWA